MNSFRDLYFVGYINTKKSPAQGEKFYSPSRVGDSVMRSYQFNF